MNTTQPSCDPVGVGANSARTDSVGALAATHGYRLQSLRDASTHSYLLMIPRIIRLLLAIGCLAIGSHHVVAQEPDTETQAKIAELDQLREDAMERKNAGQLDEAIKRLEQVYETEQSLYGEANKELLGTLDAMVQIAELQQNQQGVIEYRKRGHRITQQLYGNGDYRTQDANRSVVDAEKDLTRSPEDRARLRQAKDLNIEGM